MKKALIYILPVMLVNTAFAQHGYELKVNAGANVTLLPGYKMGITFNRDNPLFNEARDEWPTNAIVKPSYYVDGEVYKNLNNGWKMSASLGINNSCYSYNADAPDTNKKLKDINKKYGNTSLLYINSRIANISRQFSHLSLQAGPVISYLIRSKFNDIATYNYNGPNVTVLQPFGNTQKFLIGGHFNAKYKIACPLEIMLGAQYFFTPINKQQPDVEEWLFHRTKPLQLSLGLTYTPLHF